MLLLPALGDATAPTLYCSMLIQRCTGHVLLESTEAAFIVSNPAFFAQLKAICIERGCFQNRRLETARPHTLSYLESDTRFFIPTEAYQKNIL